MIVEALLAAFSFGLQIQTSLYDLLGENAEVIPVELRGESSRMIPVIASAPDAVAARAAADEFAARFSASSSTNSAARLAAFADRLDGLVTAADAERLRTPDGRAKIARAALRRRYSPLPSVFPLADDPFCLKENFLLDLAARTNQIAVIELDAALAADTEALIDLQSRLGAAAAEIEANRPGVRLRWCGVPVHTAVTAGRCRGEIAALTWFSLAVIALLSVFAFKSLKWIPLLAASLAVAALAGFAALYVCFDSVHLMTLVLGTTVLGLVIDYSFHWLLAPKPPLANLLLSWLTTEIGLLPLALSSLPVLRQTAVFLGAALAAALAFVIFVYPRRRGKSAAPKTALAMLAVAAAFGCVPVATSPTAIYRPDPQLQAAERLLAECWRMTGTTDAAALQADIVRLYAEQLDSLAARLGLESAALLPRKSAADGALQPKALLEQMLAKLTDESLTRLAVALALMFAVLLVTRRAAAFRTIAPSLIGIAAVAATVLAGGDSVNLFHLLAMFLLAGMSIDYTLFLHSGETAAMKPVVCSLLTSVAGFGALYFVSFPVVSAFGLTLGLGLPVAFGAAVLTRPRRAAADAKVEQAASPLGMEIIFLCYRLFGLRVMHALAATVGEIVWWTSPAVRRASPSRRKVRNFTRSLSDKLVVMAEGRRLPKVRLEGDAEEFIAAVRDGRGVFVLSSHVGTIEVLGAAAANPPRFHAWMDFERTSVFNRFYLRHATARRTVIHPISEIGMATAFAAGDWLDAGECLVMAGDRGGDGAFRFAHALAHPVFFAACLSEGENYVGVIRRLPDDTKSMREEYFRIRGRIAAEFPDQVFEWNE